MEVGDGTNFVIVFAGALLEKAEALLKMGLSPAEIIAGFEKACDKAMEELPSMVCYTAQNVRDQAEVEKCLKSCLASKQYGHEDFLAGLVGKACIEAMPEEKESIDFNVDYVRVAKIVGKGVLSSTITKGMIFRRNEASAIDTKPTPRWPCTLAPLTGSRRRRRAQCSSRTPTSSSPLARARRTCSRPRSSRLW